MQEITKALAVVCLTPILGLFPGSLFPTMGHCESAYRLTPLVVTASRIATEFPYLGRKVTVLSEEEIRRSPAHAIPELLAYVLGLDIRTRGPYGIQADVGIRGTSFSQVLVLIDGVRANDPQTGHHNLNLPLGLQDVERIEILYGHGTSLYGPDAFGGVINIIPKRASGNGISTEANIGMHRTAAGRIAYARQIGRFGTRSAIEHARSDGYRFDTDFKILNLSSTSRVEGTQGRFDLSLGFQDKTFGANGFYAPYPSKEWTQTGSIRVGARIEREGGVALVSQFHYRRHRDRFVLDVKRPEWYSNRHITHLYGGEIYAALPLTDTRRLVVGSEGIGEGITSSSLGDRHNLRGALFVEYRDLIAHRISLNGGIRADRHSRYGWEYGPTLSIGYAVRSSANFYGSIGRAFRAPSFTDYYYHSPANVGDPNLRPEQSWSYEIGAEAYPAERIRCTVSGFLRYERNLIDWIKAVPDAPWRATNIGEVRVAGTEISSRLIFGSYLYLVCGYAYLSKQSTRIESVISKYAFDYPEHHIVLRINGLFPRGFSAAWYLRYRKHVRRAAPLISHVRLSKRLRKWELFVEITNLFDKSYEEILGVPIPGRSVSVGYIR